MRHTGLSIVVLSLLLAVAACGEKPQTAGERKTDAHAFEGAAASFTASGWKPGDEASWQQQMKNRAQGQNEYSRTSP